MDTSTRSTDSSRSRPWTDPRTVLQAVLATPDEQPDLADADLRRSLVAGLADDDPTIRFASSWAIRLLAGDQPNALPGLVGYLVANRDASEDIRSVLAHLDDQYPALVRPVLTERDVDPATLSAETDQGPAPPAVAGRTHPLTTRLDEIRQVIETAGEMPTVIEREMNDTSEISPEDGEPTAIESGDDQSDPGAGPTGHTEADPDSERADGATGSSDETTDSADEGAESTQGAADAADGTAGPGWTGGTDERAAGPGWTPPRTVTQQKRTDIETIESSDVFRAIRTQCRFDDLQVVLPRDGRRYADTIRARALTGREETGTAVRLLDRPAEESRDLPGYTEAVAETLARWQGACTAEGIVTVHDWAGTPRPWLATEPVEKSIAEWTPPSVGARLRCALHLAESVASCHRQGVIHAGLDPGNVVVPADALSLECRPLLDNVGLLLALREYFDLSEYLDLRYAAPEYFDDSYGSIDHSTDIYQLGTVLYRLFTGRAPFEGTEAEVREQVLAADPPAPSEHNAALPEAIDDVVWKAIAKRKLVRYETATQLRADLRGVCEQSGYEIHT